METILQLVALPAIGMIVCAYLNGALLRKVSAVLQWAQMAVVVWLFGPVFVGAAPTIQLAPDFVVDKLAAAFLLLTTLVMTVSITQCDLFFREEERLGHGHSDYRWFYACANGFLLGMTFVYVCNNLGYMWISLEATTLFSAWLVYHDRTKNALEATWKYIIICSVGIAFALLGTVLIFAASQHGAIPGGSLNISELTANASKLNTPLLRLGFIFCLLGFGTKAGVFPLHNWLPDAHSEAPAPASAMLSAALLNCALWGIWRTGLILGASHHAPVTSEMVIYVGAVSTVAAGLLLIRQHSFKRMWAYSSIENVGIMLIAIGLGSGSLFFLQALNHSIAKTALFLITGNITQASGTKRLNNLHGIIRSSPIWGILLALGAMAAVGVPPFGSFVSELGILVSSADGRHWPVALMLVLGVSISFIAVSAHVGRILAGPARKEFQAYNTVKASLIPAALVICSLVLGITLRPEYWMHLQ